MKGKNKNRTIYKYNLYILGSRLSFSLALYDKRFIILILLGDNLKQEFVSGRLLHYSRRRLDWNTTRITGEKKCCVTIQYLRYKIIIILLRPDACMTTAARTITVLHGLWISMIKASVNLKQNNKTSGWSLACNKTAIHDRKWAGRRTTDVWKSSSEHHEILQHNKFSG